ncbi:major facilitator superfamily domain-containing protein [Mycena capillaripes]|nr:major facilitator superfamily domain-containing protein [Mycena capillaripes]
MSTEQDPLLEPEAPQPQNDLERAENPIHPYYIAVVAFLAKLCFFISTTTQVEILRELVCRLYWTYHDEAHSPLPGDKCQDLSVRQYFTVLKTIVVIMEGLGGLVMYGPMSRLSGRYGRRSMMILLTVLLILATFCIIGAHRLPIFFTAPLLVSWLILISITGSWQFDLMTAMYVADTTTAHARTSSLSIVLGWGYFAGVPGFALGGAVTTHTGSNTAVYWLVIALALILLGYIAFVLPESFDKPKRVRLQEQWESESAGRGRAGYLESFFRPLALLKPHRNPTTGAWNLRLLWCGIHAFTSGIASGYIWTAILVYLALHLGYKPDENGYLLTAGAVATGVSLVIITPLAIKFGRPFYRATDMRSRSGPEPEGTTSEGSKMDTHLAMFGWILDVVAIALFPLARTRMQVLIPIIILGASYFRISAFRSVVVASGDPVRSGEILAAIQTVTSLGIALSGLVLGSVLSASINTSPGLVFRVYSAIASVSVIALCLIRESDKYVAPLN